MNDVIPLSVVRFSELWVICSMYREGSGLHIIWGIPLAVVIWR